jgi:hypothetical protein
MHTRVGKSRSLATAHWTASNLQQQLTAAAAYRNLQPATTNDSNSIVAASDDFAVRCPTFREKGRNIILLLKDFITFWSMLHFTYWSQQKSYLLELCEELSTGAT